MTTTITQQPALHDQILELARQQPEGYPLCEETLSHLAAKPDLLKALNKLEAANEVLHFNGEEAYFLRPNSQMFGKSIPCPNRSIEQLAELRSETLVANGCAAANSMRLTTQCVVKIMFLTSGETRDSKFGNLDVIYRKAEPWELLFTDNQPGYVDPVCGRAIRAISFQSRYHGEKSAERVKQMLSRKEWRSILAVRDQLPVEVRESIAKTRLPARIWAFVRREPKFNPEFA